MTTKMTTTQITETRIAWHNARRFAQMALDAGDSEAAKAESIEALRLSMELDKAGALTEAEAMYRSAQ